MIGAIDALLSNINMGFEWTVMIVFLVAGLVFMAKNVIIGMILYFIGSASISMWFYHAGYAYGIPLTLMFMCIVILSFLIYLNGKAARNVGFA